MIFICLWQQKSLSNQKHPNFNCVMWKVAITPWRPQSSWLLLNLWCIGVYNVAKRWFLCHMSEMSFCFQSRFTVHSPPNNRTWAQLGPQIQGLALILPFQGALLPKSVKSRCRLRQRGKPHERSLRWMNKWQYMMWQNHPTKDISQWQECVDHVSGPTFEETLLRAHCGNAVNDSRNSVGTASKIGRLCEVSSLCEGTIICLTEESDFLRFGPKHIVNWLSDWLIWACVR